MASGVPAAMAISPRLKSALTQIQDDGAVINAPAHNIGSFLTRSLKFNPSLGVEQPEGQSSQLCAASPD
jgi:hypothetical protein